MRRLIRRARRRRKRRRPSSFAGASLASRCGVGRSRDCCCCCGRGCGGGAWVTGPLPLAGDGVSEPDECRFEGVPSNRGISSGVTTSTTTASGGGAWKAFAPTKNKPTIRAARWPMTETASPWRMYRFNPIIHGVSRYRPAGVAAYFIPAN